MGEIIGGHPQPLSPKLLFKVWGVDGGGLHQMTAEITVPFMFERGQRSCTSVELHLHYHHYLCQGPHCPQVTAVHWVTVFQTDLASAHQVLTWEQVR